ncbi:hypothetical protein BDR04DRAFT_1146743 [Suillus decipiens]|nr:hypothetical protein BDR04DRAFT_1146743 [Suillus decipiens]
MFRTIPVRNTTHNSQIEHLWVEVGTQFARRWRAFFTQLENYHGLHPDISSHVWLLQTLFLDKINQDCLDFQAEWNCHPIHGPDTNDKSPKDLRFLGQVQFSVYRDDCEGIHPDTRVGHPMDEEDSDDDEEPQNIVQAINDQQRDHVHHEAISVPLQRKPFVNDETHQQFSAILTEVVAKDITPCHCKLTADEWEGNEYPIFETIPIGQWGSKELHVSLAELIWFKQAKLWYQALVILSYFVAAGRE